MVRAPQMGMKLLDFIIAAVAIGCTLHSVFLDLSCRGQTTAYFYRFFEVCRRVRLVDRNMADFILELDQSVCHLSS